MILTRAVAEVVFPIPADLVAEDVWLGNAASAVADLVLESPDVVLEYRIHAGNSNPRHQGFAAMSKSMHARHRAWAALLGEPRLPIGAEERVNLQRLWAAEQWRMSGKPIRIVLLSRLSVPQRLALASMASRHLYAIRTRFYRLFSGWR